MSTKDREKDVDKEKFIKKYKNYKSRKNVAAAAAAQSSMAAVREEVVAAASAVAAFAPEENTLPILDLEVPAVPVIPSLQASQAKSDLGVAADATRAGPLAATTEASDAAGAALTLRDDDAERDDGVNPSQIVDIPPDPGETMADPFGYFHNEYVDFRRTLPISEDEKPALDEMLKENKGGPAVAGE